jgi:hypothetical protein
MGQLRGISLFYDIPAMQDEQRIEFLGALEDLLEFAVIAAIVPQEDKTPSSGIGSGGPGFECLGGYGKQRLNLG